MMCYAMADSSVR